VTWRVEKKQTEMLSRREFKRHAVPATNSRQPGGGPSFLFDILSLARSGIYFGEVSAQPEERVQYVLEEWRKIEADPTSTTKHFFGHSYRYWSSFLPSSPMQWLETVDAKIYIAQGTADQAVDPASADMLYGHLLAHGKQPVYDRVEGADHSFGFADRSKPHGWPALYDRIVAWFLNAPKGTQHMRA